MRMHEQDVNDNRILVVSLSSDDLVIAFSRAPHFDFFEALGRLLISGYESRNSTSRVASPPLVVIDLSDAELDLMSSERWFKMILLKKAQFVNYVRDRSGKVVFCGLDDKADCHGFSVASTLEAAIGDLVRHRSEIRIDSELVTPVTLPSKICLVGCPDNDIGYLSQDFKQIGIDTGEAHSIGEGDFVIFCLHSGRGPTEGTRSAIESGRGKSFIPLAIVLTTYGCLGSDDSMRALLTLEEQELISAVLPNVDVESLPVLQDVDPALITKLIQLVADRR